MSSHCGRWTGQGGASEDPEGAPVPVTEPALTSYRTRWEQSPKSLGPDCSAVFSWWAST